MKKSGKTFTVRVGLFVQLVGLGPALWGNTPAIHAQTPTPTPQHSTPISLDIMQLGFLNLDTEGGMVPNVVRNGELAPLVIRLSNRDSREFKGRLEISVPDSDGDLITIRNEMIALTPHQQRRIYILPFPTNFGDNSPRETHVRLLDSDGRRIKSATLNHEEVKVLNDDQRLIVSLSSQNLPLLAGENNRRTSSPEQKYEFVCSRLDPEFFPLQPALLAAADTIVWNNPDPSRLSPVQLQILLDWVRAGGWLVLCPGTNYALLNASGLGPFLPAQITRMDSFRYEGPSAAKNVMLGTFADLQPDSEVLVRLPTQSLLTLVASQPLALYRRLGSGRVVLTACDWPDVGRILGQDKSRTDLDLLLGQNAWVVRHRPGNPQPSNVYHSEVKLGDHIRSLINFDLAQSLYLLVGTLTLAGYVVLMTFGVTAFLRHQKMLAHSWSAFALVAVVCGGLALVGVRALKGQGLEVHQVNFVNLSAGSREGLACSFFGLKSGDDRKVAVGLTPLGLADTPEMQARTSLYPLIADGGGVKRYLAAQAYTMNFHSLSTTRLYDGVPLRSTLKQFVGQYPIRLQGAISGELNPSEWPNMPSISGWIKNGLNVRLRNCRLIWNQSVPLGRGARAMSAFILPIIGVDNATVGPGETVDVGRLYQRSQAGLDKLNLQLQENQWGWAQNLVPNPFMGSSRPERVIANRDVFVSAALLTTTAGAFVSDLDVSKKTDQKPDWEANVEYELKRSLFRSLDQMTTLGHRQALVVAFSDDLVPGELCVNEQKTPPTVGNNVTVLRVRIPVSLPTATKPAD